MKIAKDAVVIGNVPSDATVGEGSVVIGATDTKGNVILNTSMAIGRAAEAASGSIAIGAYATAGSSVQSRILESDLKELANIVVATHDEALIRALEHLKEEIRAGPGNRSGVMVAWRGLSSLATIDGAHSLLERISRSLPVIFG